MKKKTISILSAFMSLLMLCSLCLGLAGCAVSVKAADLMAGIESKNTSEPGPVSAGEADAAARFAVQLLRNSPKSDRGTLVSPLSVLSALAMSANGAEGETLSQIEAAMGMSRGDMNVFMRNYVAGLPGLEGGKLLLANSIWIKDDPRLSVKESFLQTNADYYGAGAYKAPFDNSTLSDINGWVKEKTEGMIPKILKKIPGDAGIYLVNALSFEAKWLKVYEKDDVSDGIFTAEDGTEQKVRFMKSGESRYLENANCTGFIKPYEHDRFAFAALLPKEGMSMEDFVASLDGAEIREMLSSPETCGVGVSMPKFDLDYSASMKDALKAMGIKSAFEEDEADFSSLGTMRDGIIYLNEVFHKTYISVGEKGTKAGAATAFEFYAMEAESLTEKEVRLDRPFVYMLIDTDTCVPFFIGTFTSVK